MPEDPDFDPDAFPSIEAINALNDENQNRTHRGTVLVAAAALDETLEQTLRLFMVKCRVTDKLLDPNGQGAISSFNARVEVCLALGLISAKDADCCKLAGKIRNEHAHKLTASLNSGRLLDQLKHCESLVWPDGVDHGLLNPQQRFSGVCVRLIIQIRAFWSAIRSSSRTELPN